MAYTIYFIGLACFAGRNKDAQGKFGAYTVALPDGRNYKGACTGAAAVHDHLPYLLIPMTHLVSSYAKGMVMNDCFIVPLENSLQGNSAITLRFEYATSAGTVDDTDMLANGYSWANIDSGFSIDPGNLQGHIVDVPLERGTMKAWRVQDANDAIESAVITSAEIATTVGPAPPVTVKVLAGAEEITFKDGAEVIVANVDPNWLTSTKYPDDDEHFFIYHRLSAGALTGCKKPVGKKPAKLTGKKIKYLTVHRGLRVSCSNTVYP